MSDMEKLGGSLDHLNEQGLKQLVRDLQSKLYALESQLRAADELAKAAKAYWAIDRYVHESQYLKMKLSEVLAAWEKARKQ